MFCVERSRRRHIAIRQAMCRAADPLKGSVKWKFQPISWACGNIIDCNKIMLIFLKIQRQRTGIDYLGCKAQRITVQPHLFCDTRCQSQTNRIFLNKNCTVFTHMHINFNRKHFIMLPHIIGSAFWPLSQQTHTELWEVFSGSGTFGNFIPYKLAAESFPSACLASGNALFGLAKAVFPV